MILNKKQIEEFKEATRPIMKWLNENCTPHTTVIVTPSDAEVLCRSAAIQNEEYIKD